MAAPARDTLLVIRDSDVVVCEVGWKKSYRGLSKEGFNQIEGQRERSDKKDTREPSRSSGAFEKAVFGFEIALSLSLSPSHSITESKENNEMYLISDPSLPYF